MNPAPNPAITVRGPEIFPSASESSALNLSNATKPMSSRINIHHPPSLYVGEVRTNSRLDRIANNQRRAPRIPLSTEGRERQFLTIWQTAIKLCSSFRDCDFFSTSISTFYRSRIEGKTRSSTFGWICYCYN